MDDSVPLGELVTLQRGQSYKSAFLGEPGPTLLGLGTIGRNGGFRADNLRTYGGPTPENILVRSGDIYVSLKDVTHAADLLGAVARVPHSVALGRLTQDTTQLEIVSERIDSDYLYWTLLNPHYRAYCRTRGTGTTNLDLSRKDFLSYRVRLPSLGEQRAIAEVLGALDDKIAANAKLIESLEALATHSTRKVSMLVELSELVNHRKSSVRPAGLEAPTVAHYSLPAFDDGQSPGFEEPSHIKSNKYAISKPAVLVSKLNPRFPRIWNVPSIPSMPALASTEFLVLEPKVASSTVLWAVLAAPSFAAALRGKVAGTSGSHQRVRPADLLATPVLDIRTFGPELSERVTALGLRAEQARQESIDLTATRDALLPALMSGKLRVKDAERQVEEAL